MHNEFTNLFPQCALERSLISMLDPILYTDLSVAEPYSIAQAL
ncbi:hypothetical protein [Vacuolonema iberomarrocanum]